VSNSTPEVDGFHDLLTDREQEMFDLAFDREGRREKQGYVTPAQARAFLQMARQLQLGQETPPQYNRRPPTRIPPVHLPICAHRGGRRLVHRLFSRPGI
jgi:hypothetical protein